MRLPGLLGLIFMLGGQATAEQPVPSPPPNGAVAVQPYGKVAEEFIKAVVARMEATFTLPVEVLKARALPSAAYYKPNNRYRGIPLLDDLRSPSAATSRMPATSPRTGSSSAHGRRSPLSVSSCSSACPAVAHDRTSRSAIVRQVPYKAPCKIELTRR
jgi:hypothetical protein